MKRIPEGLKFEDLTDEQKRVLTFAYQRWEAACQTMHSRLVADRVSATFFEAQSEEQVIEQELWELGLLARIPTQGHKAYGYQISYDGAPFVGRV